MSDVRGLTSDDCAVIRAMNGFISMNHAWMNEVNALISDGEPLTSGVSAWTSGMKEFTRDTDTLIRLNHGVIRDVNRFISMKPARMNEVNALTSEMKAFTNVNHAFMNEMIARTNEMNALIHVNHAFTREMNTPIRVDHGVIKDVNAFISMNHARTNEVNAGARGSATFAFGVDVPVQHAGSQHRERAAHHAQNESEADHASLIFSVTASVAKLLMTRASVRTNFS